MKILGCLFLKKCYMVIYLLNIILFFTIQPFRSVQVFTMKFGEIYNCIRLFSTQHIVPKVCIIGAGPAGFYAAQQLLKVCITFNILK